MYFQHFHGIRLTLCCALFLFIRYDVRFEWTVQAEVRCRRRFPVDEGAVGGVESLFPCGEALVRCSSVVFLVVGDHPCWFSMEYISLWLNDVLLFVDWDLGLSAEGHEPFVSWSKSKCCDVAGGIDRDS